MPNSVLQKGFLMAKLDRLLIEAETFRTYMSFALGLVVMAMTGAGVLFVEQNSLSNGLLIMGGIILFALLWFSAIMFMKMKIRYQSLLDDIEQEET